MDELLDLSASDVFHRRHEHVGAHIITNEKLNHTVSCSVADLDSLPEILTGEAVSSSGGDGTGVRYIRHSGGLIRVEFSPHARYGNVRAFFPDEESAKKFQTVLKRYVAPKPTPEDKVAMNFWNWGGDSAARTIRRVDVPRWEAISGNYTASASDKLTETMKVVPSGNLSGKLILWRGAPGTGKTWSLRALCREWRNWCSTHYIIDPDVFFTNASYMVGLLMSMPNDAIVIDPDDEDYDPDMPPPSANTKQIKKAPHWNLLILEDAGELVGADSKARTGQALSKLLNLSDGLLGQGINLMVLITTNEDYEALHPAIGRQGRCLSNVSFDAFNEAEAAAWLKARDCAVVPRGKRTLADLYAHLDERKTIQNEAERRAVGFRS